MAYFDKMIDREPSPDSYNAKLNPAPWPDRMIDREPNRDSYNEKMNPAPWPGYYYSAYGIAVKHGYLGTEEEWLESLKGRDGNNLIELNDGIEVKIWVGSIEEYNALPRLEESVLYFIEEPIR